MKTFFVCLLSLVFAVARAEELKPQEALQTVVENEGKFFQLGQEQGTRAAFLAFLADDGIVFRPGPVNGKESWKKRPEKEISLSWKPLFAAIASSADLAYTTGPAEWRHNKEDAKPFGYGQFVSIWKRQKDGSWKVALDVGSEVPGLTKSDEPPQLEMSVSSPPAAKPTDAKTAQRQLREAEAQFATAAKADSTIALSEASSLNVRVHREGVFPAVGKDPARLMLSVRRGKLSLERTGGGMSAAGDLAYSYGTYSLVKPQETERGYYLQIWRTEPDGSWKLALDYQTPLPTEEKKK
jgi:ketosteroid isomerase-like protein